MYSVSVFAVVTTCTFLLPFLVEPVKHSSEYSTSWAVEIDGGSLEADRLASRHGFLNRGQIGSLHNCYHFVLKDSSHQFNPHRTEALSLDVKVKYAEQQVIREHVKRDYVVPTDPGWPQEWSLKNTGQTGASSPLRLDSRVEQAWLQGFTGQGVLVAVVDEGLEWKHRDLIDNYNAQLSFDFIGNDSDPTPEKGHAHGTECAGVIAMSKNKYCGIGVAYDSTLVGIKTEIEVSVDLSEAASLSHAQDSIDVYSNSWGPKDNGFTIEAIGPLVTRTFENGAEKGRNGKGNIYVWAAGNGGDSYDSCAADGFVNSIYTIAVGSADQNGQQAEYDEDCSAKMAVTFSYNSNDNGAQLYTTTADGQCTERFTGTSAAAPLLSGVVALALQANPNLTWRDVQYLIVYTSNPDILTGDDWVTNGAGLRVSHHFGFGAIDAEAMVTRARHWTNVPDQHNFTIPATPLNVSSLLVHFNVGPEHTLTSLEHLIITMSLSISTTGKLYSLTDYSETQTDDIDEWLRDPHPRRGDIRIELTSPSGTTSILLPYREYDFINEEGYNNWPFMSVHFWGENPVGTWTLQTTFRSSNGTVGLGNVTMTAFGVNDSEHNTNRGVCELCTRGCLKVCDVCPELRLNTSLACVSVCPNGTTEYSGYCIVGDIIYPHNSAGELVVGVASIASVVVVVLTIVVVIVVIVALIMRKRRKIDSNVNYAPLELELEEIAHV